MRRSAGSASTRSRSVIAPVGHASTHAPHATQSPSANRSPGRRSSRAPAPRPSMPYDEAPLDLLAGAQAATACDAHVGAEAQVGVARVDRPGARIRDGPSSTPSSAARAASSPAPASAPGGCAATSRARTSRRRARRAGVSVTTCDAVVQSACGTRRAAGRTRPPRTRQSRQPPWGESPSRWQSVGTRIPARRGDGEDRLARARTRTERPSIVARAVTMRPRRRRSGRRRAR